MVHSGKMMCKRRSKGKRLRFKQVMRRYGLVYLMFLIPLTVLLIFKYIQHLFAAHLSAWPGVRPDAALLQIPAFWKGRADGQLCTPLYFHGGRMRPDHTVSLRPYRHDQQADRALWRNGCELDGF